jgi:hypothetical protein
MGCHPFVNDLGRSETVSVKRRLWILIIPVILSWDAVRLHSLILMVLAVLAHFGALRLTPVCKRRESLWMFLLVALSTIPLNLHLLAEYGDLVGVSRNSGIIALSLLSIIWYDVLLSVEEIIMGIITRLIWKKQYKLPDVWD